MESRTIFRSLLILLVIALMVLIAVVFLSGDQDNRTAQSTQPTSQPEAFRIGLIPERDILEQNRRFHLLAEYLGQRLDQPIEIVTARSYEQILTDLKECRVDGAFLGSLVALLSVDQLDTSILVKPCLKNGKSTYHGVIFVPEWSKIKSLEDLSHSSVAIVRTTTGGNLYLAAELARRGMLSDTAKSPKLIWSGTHDDVIDEVIAGRVDAGAVKNVRLDEYLAKYPQVHVRRLAESAEVPENALVTRAGVAEEKKSQIRRILLEMADDPQGKEVLDQIGLIKFLPCELKEYAVIYDMVDQLNGRWDIVGVDGRGPRRPASIPATTQAVP